MLALVVVACSVPGKTRQDAQVADAAPDTKLIDAAVTKMDGPPGTSPLTVKNVLSWCSVSVNGGAASTAASQIVNVQPGMITLTASPVAGFILDAHMWHHTDGDTAGTGEAGSVTGMTSTAKATVTAAAKCVWVCCPFTNGTGCAVADQCP